MGDHFRNNTSSSDEKPAAAHLVREQPESPQGAAHLLQDETQNVRSRVIPRIGIALACIVFSLCVFLFFTEMWLFKTWEALSVDEILFHLKAPLAGTNSAMIVDYLKVYGLAEAGVILGVLTLLFILRKKPIEFRFTLAFSLLAGLGLFGYALFDFTEQVKLAAFLGQQEVVEGEEPKEDFIAAHYVNPRSVSLVFPEEKRNLIYIYLESMELTYTDAASGGAFEQNVIPELTELALENECFNGDSEQLNGAIVYPGTEWTMGAIFGQSTGLPLKVAGAANDLLSRYDSFFDGLVGIGDILEKQDYHQVFLLGSDAVFGGREAFFGTHGSYDIRDHPYALENGLIPEGYHVFWGYEDMRLFDIAKQTLLELAEEETPFNLTMLTVDTHFPDGYVCELCGYEYDDDQYSNVMRCSSRQVAEFIAWIQEQDFYEDTAIVICGDHLTMDGDYCQNVPKEYRRKTYAAFINSSVEPADSSRVRQFSTLDMLPTTLASMGVSLGRQRMGLGTNLFSNVDTLTEELGVDACSAGLAEQSTFLYDSYELSASTAYIDSLSESAIIEAQENAAGTIRFFIHGIGDKLDPRNVELVEAVVTDTRTGEQVSLKMFPLHCGPSDYDIDYERFTTYPIEVLEHLEIDFRITTDEYDKHVFAHIDGSTYSEDSEGYEEEQLD